MQEFNIKVGSVLPYLRMELIEDGRFDFHRTVKFNNDIQNADVTFSMKDSETGILKISNAPAEIVLATDGGCEDKYVIQYKWNERDTRKEGIYDAWFNIDFKGTLEGTPKGNLIMPITEDLRIIVR